MEYQVRVSLIDEEYGLMGVEDIEIEADNLQEAADILNEKIDRMEADGYDCVLVDDIYDEEGNEIEFYVSATSRKYVLK